MVDSPSFAEAKKWVDSLGDKWRLQILSKRFRIDPETGVKTELPTRIRRFVEGCPWALVNDAIKYLLSRAPYRGVIYNGVPLTGDYNPTLTTWKRDDQDEIVSPTAARKNDGTYTLVQDLIEAGDVKDMYGARSSESCTEEVLTDWVWDSGSIEELPTSSEQGVSYAISSVSRNEDGTFNYALVKRVSKPQFGGWSVKRDDAAQKVEVFHADNLRGAPGAWTGLDIPASGSGVAVDVDYQQNPDCTYRVTVTKTTVKAVQAGGSCQKDQFKHQHGEEKAGQSSPLGEAPAASGGVIVKHVDRLQPDGTYHTEKTVETELPVSQSVVEVHKGRRGTRQTVTDSNQPGPAPLSPGVGGSVRVEKTPGRLYNNTVVTWIRSGLEKVASVCKFDIFNHSHSQTQSGLSSLPSGDVPKASGGVVHTRRADMDDEGAITQTDETDTEQPVRDAVVRVAVGIHGVRRTVTHRNVSSGSPALEFSLANVGKSVTVEKTPGDLRNVTEESLDRSGTRLQTGSGCEQTVFEHSDTRVVSDPTGALGSHVSAAGGGNYHRETVEMDDSGAVVRRTTDTKELSVSSADLEIRKTSRATITTKTDRNVGTTATAPGNPGEMRRHTTNPGGSKNYTEVTVQVNATPDRARSETTVFETSKDSVKLGKGSVDSSMAQPAGNGHMFHKESVVDELGVVTTTERDTREIPCAGAEVEKRRIPMAVITKTVDRNQLGASVTTPANVGESVSKTVNPGGSCNITKVTLDITPTADRAHAASTVFERVVDTVTASKGSTVDRLNPPTAGAGHYKTVDATMNGNGVIVKVERDTEEVPQASAEVDIRRTPKVKITRTTDRNVGTTASDLGSSGGQAHKMTPGGNYDFTKTEVTVLGNADRAHSEADAFHTTTDEPTVDEADSADKSPTEGGTGGAYRSKLSTVDDYGVRTTTVTTVQEKPSVSDGNIGESNLRFTSTTVSTRNNPAPAESQTASVGNTYAWTSRRTPGGNYDTTTVHRQATEMQSFSIESSSAYHVFYQTSFFNASADSVTSIGSAVARALSGLIGQKTNQYPSGFGIHCSASLNEFGLFDGYVSGVATYGPYQTGSGEFGSLDMTSSQVHIQPIWSNKYSRLLGLEVLITKYAVTSRYGYGLNMLRFNAPSSGDVMTTRAEYSPMSNLWTITYSKVAGYSVDFYPADSEGRVDMSSIRGVN